MAASMQTIKSYFFIPYKILSGLVRHKIFVWLPSKADYLAFPNASIVAVWLMCPMKDSP